VSDQSAGPEAAPGSGKKINAKATWSLIGGIRSITFCGVIVGIVAIIGG
jgi:hypothetical protein